MLDIGLNVCIIRVTSYNTSKNFGNKNYEDFI